MLTTIYRLIILFSIVLVLVELFGQRSLKAKANAALIFIPLMLRVLMIA